jgi:hypothetical protein
MRLMNSPVRSGIATLHESAERPLALNLRHRCRNPAFLECGERLVVCGDCRGVASLAFACVEELTERLFAVTFEEKRDERGRQQLLFGDSASVVRGDLLAPGGGEECRRPTLLEQPSQRGVCVAHGRASLDAIGNNSGDSVEDHRRRSHVRAEPKLDEDSGQWPRHGDARCLGADLLHDRAVTSGATLEVRLFGRRGESVE